MPIFLDGKEYADETTLEAATNPAIPESLKRVYITQDKSDEPVAPGNIDLSKRPVVNNDDGSISTVRSMSIGTDDGEVLIPTVAHDGSRVLSQDEAIQQYKDSGQHLGIFQTPDAATKYAEQLHKDQEAMYASRMPLGSPQKAGGALKSEDGTTLPVEFSNAPEPPKGLEPLIGDGGEFSKGLPLVNKLADKWVNPDKTERPPAKVLFTTKSGVEFTDHNIEDAINVGMSSGPSSIVGKFDYYINNFIKQAEAKLSPKPIEIPENFGKTKLEPMPHDMWHPNDWAKLTPEQKALEWKQEVQLKSDAGKELDPTEKAIKAIMDVLEGPGVYEAKYSKTGYVPPPGTYEPGSAMAGIADKKTVPITEHGPGTPEFNKKYGYGQFEQVPFGHTDESWAKLTKAEKNHILDNPPPFGSAPKSISAESDSLRAMTGIEASKKFHDIYEKEGASKAIQFAHKYEEHASHDNWIKYEDHVNDAGNHPNSPAFSETPKTDKVIAEIEQFLEKEAEAEAKASKLSKFDKITNKLQEVYNEHLNKEIHERAKFHSDRAKGLLTKEALDAGYDTPAFRGLKNRGDILSTHKYDKTGVMYSSDSPLLADMYADYLSKHPGWNVKEGAFSEGATVAPLVINTKDYHVFDAKGQDWQLANHKAMDEAKQRGSVGVIVKNVWDEPNSTRALGKPNTVYITFPKGASTVKSRFAEKFDPESKNMLHMVPVLAVGGAAGYVSKEIQQD